MIDPQRSRMILFAQKGVSIMSRASGYFRRKTSQSTARGGRAVNPLYRVNFFFKLTPIDTDRPTHYIIHHIGEKVPSLVKAVINNAIDSNKGTAILPYSTPLTALQQLRQAISIQHFKPQINVLYVLHAKNCMMHKPNYFGGEPDLCRQDDTAKERSVIS